MTSVALGGASRDGVEEVLGFRVQNGTGERGTASLHGLKTREWVRASKPTGWRPTLLVVMGQCGWVMSQVAQHGRVQVGAGRG
jgi:hypothetical protein